MKQQKVIDSDLKGNNQQQTYHGESFHPGQNFKLKPQRIECISQQQSERQGESGIEESENNENDDENLNTDVDISFEENNTSFLKIQKYKKQQSNKIEEEEQVNTSQEIEISSSSEIQRGSQQNKTSQSSSHSMSNYIESLKKEKNQLGYKDQFQKKKISNTSSSSQLGTSLSDNNLFLRNKNEVQKMNNNDQSNAEQTQMQYRENNSYNKGNYQQMTSQDNQQSGLQHRQLKQLTSYHRIDLQTDNTSQSQNNLNQKQFNNTNQDLQHKQHQQAQQNRLNSYEMRLVNSYSLEQEQQVKNQYKKEREEINDCEEKSDEYISSSVSSSQEKFQKENIPYRLVISDQQYSNPVYNNYQKDTFLQSEQTTHPIIESLCLNNHTPIDSYLQQQPLHLHKSHMNKSYLDKTSDSQNSQIYSQITMQENAQLNSSNKFSSNYKNTINQSQELYKNIQSQPQFQIAHSSSSSSSKPKTVNDRMERSSSQISINSHAKTSSSSSTKFAAEFQDEYKANYSPMHKLNLYKHSNKQNNASFDNKSPPEPQYNMESKQIKDILPIASFPATPLPEQNQINKQSYKQQKLHFDKNQQINQNIKQQPIQQNDHHNKQNEQMYKYNNNTNECKKQQNVDNLQKYDGNNGLQKEFFDQYYCKRVLSYEQIQDKENAFYQERKRSLENKLNDINKTQNIYPSVTSIKEEQLQVITERLILELRMANKVISFLECQNQFFLRKVEEIQVKQQDKAEQTLRNVFCKNCSSQSLIENDNNTVFSQIIQQQQQGTNSKNKIECKKQVYEQQQTDPDLEQNRYSNKNDESNMSQKKQSTLFNLSNNHSVSNELSLHEDFKNLVEEFQSLKSISQKQQLQIEELEKENMKLLRETIVLKEDMMNKESMIQLAELQYESDKENLIEELNKLTKENLDIRDEFSSEIKRIKAYEAKEFHELENKVRQTIQKKDDYIYKLNQIISELKDN